MTLPPLNEKFNDPMWSLLYDNDLYFEADPLTYETWFISIPSMSFPGTFN